MQIRESESNAKKLLLFECPLLAWRKSRWESCWRGVGCSRVCGQAPGACCVEPHCRAPGVIAGTYALTAPLCALDQSVVFLDQSGGVSCQCRLFQTRCCRGKGVQRAGEVHRIGRRLGLGSPPARCPPSSMASLGRPESIVVSPTGFSAELAGQRWRQCWQRRYLRVAARGSPGQPPSGPWCVLAISVSFLFLRTRLTLQGVVAGIRCHSVVRWAPGRGAPSFPPPLSFYPWPIFQPSPGVHR